MFDEFAGVLTAKRERRTTFEALFPDGIPAAGGEAIPTAEALAALGDVAAELGAISYKLQHALHRIAMTLVRDYEGIGACLMHR